MALHVIIYYIIHMCSIQIRVLSALVRSNCPLADTALLFLAYTHEPMLKHRCRPFYGILPCMYMLTLLALSSCC